MIDPYKRYQTGLTLRQLFPQLEEGICACGCKTPLSGRKKRWASKTCQDNALFTFLIVKGDNSFIRKAVFERDNGVCISCEKQCSDWQADHILPVALGGGGCDLDNFQTLCKNCHMIKNSISKSGSTKERFPHMLRRYVSFAF